MNYPTLHLQTSGSNILVHKIDDLLNQIYQYIEAYEEDFKTQMDEIYVHYWEEIKTTAKALYLTFELDNYVDYIETCDKIHPDELSDVMYEALVDETPFELFYQLKHLKDFVPIEGTLYDEIIKELDQMQSDQTVIEGINITHELEKKFILLGYNIVLRDVTFTNEEEYMAYEHQPNDPYVIFKNQRDEIDGFHYLDGYYF
ncbi:hypothetical protein [Faecalibacter sp. LW9]|uniref:hypothetical protein n=1 Tax=Faecalibacter sp. LW9 TaxID=3103144 RepID=UPI002AFE769E|nr:hypothetical protein [Faecalibacter sp. LW9]